MVERYLTEYEAMLDFHGNDPRAMAAASLKKHRQAYAAAQQTMAEQDVQATRRALEEAATMAEMGVLPRYAGLYPDQDQV